jgi:hypothetical protein
MYRIVNDFEIKTIIWILQSYSELSVQPKCNEEQVK